MIDDKSRSMASWPKDKLVSAQESVTAVHTSHVWLNLAKHQRTLTSRV